MVNSQPHSSWRLTGRFSHDLSEFADLLVIPPQHKAGWTNVSTDAVVAELMTFLGRGFNELSIAFPTTISPRRIRRAPKPGGRRMGLRFRKSDRQFIEPASQ